MAVTSWAPHTFFEVVVWSGFILLLLVCIPIQLASKLRRLRRRRATRVCRICGYRFLRKDDHCTCPVCTARNR